MTNGSDRGTELGSKAQIGTNDGMLKVMVAVGVVLVLAAIVFAVAFSGGGGGGGEPSVHAEVGSTNAECAGSECTSATGTVDGVVTNNGSAEASTVKVTWWAEYADGTTEEIASDTVGPVSADETPVEFEMSVTLSGDEWDRIEDTHVNATAGA